MEATENQERIEEAQEIPVVNAARNGTAVKMFKYSEFVDVGEGASECEHARDGECDDVEHFHAWCRLPNQYQREDIRKKGLAAKARKIRELTDPASDASVVLDQELDRIDDPMFRGQLVDEMLSREWAQDYVEADADVSDREEFETITQDREELQRLKLAEGHLPEEEWSEDYKAALKRMSAFVDAVSARMTEIQGPKRSELEERSPGDLVKLVRQRRVEDEASTAFLDTYHAWMWFVGTFKVNLHESLRRPYIAAWNDIGQRDRPAAGTMFGEADEVITVLGSVFNRLSLALQNGSAGN